MGIHQGQGQLVHTPGQLFVLPGDLNELVHALAGLFILLAQHGDLFFHQGNRLTTGMGNEDLREKVRMLVEKTGMFAQIIRHIFSRNDETLFRFCRCIHKAICPS